MHIEIDTEHLSRPDALALAALIEAKFPGITPLAERVTHKIGDASVTIERRDAAADSGYGSDLGEALDDGVKSLDPTTAFAAPPTLDPATAFSTPPLADASPVGAPAPPAGAPSNPIAGVELDADNLPWDARIHAGTRRKNADGRWTSRKGVGNDAKALVTQELRAVMAAGPSAPPPPIPAISLPPAVIAAAEAAALADPSFGDTRPSDAGALFAAAMRKNTDAQRTGKLTAANLATIIADLGLNQMRDLLVRPDLIPAFEDQIAAYVASA